MAGEEIFTANALISATGALIFLALFCIAYIEKNKILQYVFLGAVILVMAYAFAVQRVGFNATGLYTLRELSFAILDILIWIFVALFLLSAATIGFMCVQALGKALGKDSSYENE